MTARTKHSTNAMPLFPSEAEIARAVLGERAAEWPGKAAFLEAKYNLPPIDPLMGGRPWAAVKKFFLRRAGLDVPEIAQTIGPASHIRIIPPREAPHAEETAPAQHRGSERRPRRARA